MTIQQAIEKANENGYRSDALAIVKNTFVVFDEDGEEEIEEFAQVFMDPLFWQSLGESLGWDEGLMEDDTYKTAPVTRYMWKHQWHRFVDALAEGKSADDFFKGL